MTQPIAQYLFNSNTKDEIGGYDGSQANLTYDYAPEGYNFATMVVKFNGTSSKFATPDISSIKGNHDRTFEFWACITSQANNYNTIFTQGLRNHTQNFGFLQYSNSGNYNLLGIDNFGSNVQYDHQIEYLNLWTHFAIVFSGSQITDVKLYINGRIKKFRHTPSKQYEAVDTSDGTTAFFFDKNLNNRFTAGSVGNLRIYDAALSTSEIRNHYQNESGRRVATPNYLCQYRRTRTPGPIMKKGNI